MSALPAVRFLDRTTPPHIVTLVLMAGIGAMNMSAFLPSLPAMTEDFGTDYAVMQLSVSLYLAVTAVIQVFIGPLSDRYGRRPMMLGCFIVFVLASIGCALSTSVEMFLFFRMLQTSIAVALALSRAIIRDMVSQEEAASMIGYVTMGMALVPMVAPMIGGALDEAFGWRSSFVFLALAGAVIGAIIWADQGETLQRRDSRFRDQVREYPELLTSRRFWGYVFAAAFASGAFFAFLGGAPYVASEIYGLSAFWAGVGFGAPAIGYAAGNYISGRYSVRVGINDMILWGTIVTLAGLVVGAAITGLGYGSAPVFFLFCTFVGLGNGMTIPNANAGLLSVRPHLAGTASGLGGAFMIGGGAATSVLAGIVLVGAATSLPLLLLMAFTSALAYLCILYVIRREKQLGLS